MKPVKYFRKGHLIIDADEFGRPTDTAQNLKTINAAKKESRRLQKELDGGLGLGSVHVLK